MENYLHTGLSPWLHARHTEGAWASPSWLCLISLCSSSSGLGSKDEDLGRALSWRLLQSTDGWKSGTTDLTFQISGSDLRSQISPPLVEVLPPSGQVIESTSVQRANGAVSLKIDRNPHQKHLSRHDRKINPGRLLLALYESSCCYSNFISSWNLKAKHSWNNITALSKNDI